VLGAGLAAGCGGESEGAPKAPTNLTALLVPGPVVTLAWRDNSDNEMTFVIERRANGGNFSVLAMPEQNVHQHYDRTIVPDNDYSYRVAALNATGQSGFTEEMTVNVPKN
jgi:hypothetical protein